MLLPTHQKWPYQKKFLAILENFFFLKKPTKDTSTFTTIFLSLTLLSVFEILYLYGQHFGPYTVYSKRKNISNSKKQKKKQKKKKKKMAHLPTQSEIDG